MLPAVLWERRFDARIQKVACGTSLAALRRGNRGVWEQQLVLFDGQPVNERIDDAVDRGRGP
jgi:hypothetical protein